MGFMSSSTLDWTIFFLYLATVFTFGMYMSRRDSKRFLSCRAATSVVRDHVVAFRFEYLQWFAGGLSR